MSLTYTYTPLIAPDGEVTSPLSINDFGQIVGNYKINASHSGSCLLYTSRCV